ncbi:MAG TPA: signal peptidase II [Thermoanaerobaculia bacterium]|nr:signal peptidase II [Thermoanaerobaculia bacterium]
MKRLQYGVVSLAIIIFDMYTKWLVTRNFDLNESRQVIPDFFQLVHVQNTGAAFGIGANSASPFVPMLLNFGAIGVFTIVAIYSFRSAVSDRLLQFGLHLILGGAIGNLIDRFRFGSVVDFLDFYVTLGGTPHHWPAFNVADSAICIGIGLLFLDMRRRPAETEAQATTAA